jgi:hypothetical protein
MADGALLLICYYAGPLYSEIRICRKSPPFNEVTMADTLPSNQIITADCKREHHRITLNMNSNELNKLKRLRKI